MTIRERIAAHLRIDESRVGLGIGLGDPTDHRDALMFDGRSVWAADAPIDVAVTESPNWFGVRDGPDQLVVNADLVRCDRHGDVLAPLSDAVEMRASQDDHSRAVRQLAGALSTHKGISLPWGRPVCSWFSVRTRIPASAWQQFRGDGKVDAPPDPFRAFLPGLVRVTPPAGFVVSEYAAALVGFVGKWVHEEQRMKGTT